MEELKPCSKCGSIDYYVTIDSRGVPEARCKECDSQVQKVGSKFMYDYFVNQISTIYERQEHEEDMRPPCKYCTERWAILDGRMGVRPREMNDIKFCPMCGRKLKPTDKDY